ncbi:MAG: hypothetical protein HZA48_03900 [Planctomycetes bacterium]|nr:hypothetical protein [Planctomycetota bacterium]
MTIPELFNTALNKPHTDLYERLEFGKENRIFTTGFYAEGLITLLSEKNVIAKIFTNEKISANNSNCSIVQLEGRTIEKIAAFPDNTFNIISFSWPGEWQSIAPLLEEFRRVTKPGGQTAILALKDSTPTPVMAILKKTLEKKYQGRAKFCPPVYPESVKTIRKAFDKAGFVSIRVWEDSFAFDVTEALLKEYSDILLNQLLPPDDKILKKEDLQNAFLNELVSNCKDGVLHITYEYLGGIGYK